MIALLASMLPSIVGNTARVGGSKSFIDVASKYCLDKDQGLWK